MYKRWPQITTKKAENYSTKTERRAEKLNLFLQYTSMNLQEFLIRTAQKYKWMSRDLEHKTH